MTAERIVSAARALGSGVKESPANSNRVKYNTAYYGRAVSGTAVPKPEYIRALLDRYHGKTGN